MQVWCGFVHPIFLQGSNAVNEAVENAANRTGRLFIVHSMLGEQYILRLSVGTPSTTLEHVADAWKVRACSLSYTTQLVWKLCSRLSAGCAVVVRDDTAATRVHNNCPCRVKQ